MSQERARKLLAEVGAVLTNDHFVYTSGRHGDTYVNKDAVTLRPDILDEFAANIAQQYARYHRIEAVVSPAVGAIGLGLMVAWHLNRGSIEQPVLFAYTDKVDAEGTLQLGRGFPEAVKGKRVLVVEDLLTTGGSAKKTVEAVEKAGGKVIGVAAVVNRGGVLPHDLGVDSLYTTLKVELQSWSEEECPLCKQGVPINTEFGHGKEFLARKAQQSNL